MSTRTLVDELLAITNDPSTNLTSPLIPDFDWARAGVSTPYIIFFTGRCGSTWLTSLVQETGLAGSPEEFLNEDVAKSAVRPECRGIADYFGDVVSRWTQKGRFGLQVDPIRLKQILRLVDIGRVFRDAAVFYMYRRDLLAQGWSWAAARKSGIWHSPPGEERRGIPEPPSLADIAREIYRVRREEEYLQSFIRENGMQPFPIEYEWLVAESMSVLTAMFTVMGIPQTELASAPTPTGNQLNRLEYDVKQQTIAQLWSTCPDVCESLFRKRHSLPAAELRKSLVAVFGEEFLLNA